MAKGIIYITTTATTGLIKIGQTNNFESRMRTLSNGYRNVTHLKPYFAIEVDDYIEKERLLQEIFSKSRVGDSELFALDQELVRQLLLSFDGKVIFPKDINKEKEFDEVTTARKQGALFSFYKKGIKNGDTIAFIANSSETATVSGEREVEYGGQIWKLSPLTDDIFERIGGGNKSRAYQGANYWQFAGKKLKDLPDIN